jgi:hypothetical protein
MPTWESLRQSVNRITDKVNTAAEELADQAAVQIKLSNRRADLDREYRELGRLAYGKLTPASSIPADLEAEKIDTEQQGTDDVDPDTTPDELTEQINAAINRITAILNEIALLEKKVK